MPNDNQSPRHIQISSVPADVSAAITLLLDSLAEIAKVDESKAFTVIDGLRELAADAAALTTKVTGDDR